MGSWLRWQKSWRTWQNPRNDPGNPSEGTKSMSEPLKVWTHCLGQKTLKKKKKRPKLRQFSWLWVELVELLGLQPVTLQARKVTSAGCHVEPTKPLAISGHLSIQEPSKCIKLTVSWPCWQCHTHLFTSCPSHKLTSKDQTHCNAWKVPQKHPL